MARLSESGRKLAEFEVLSAMKTNGGRARVLWLREEALTHLSQTQIVQALQRLAAQGFVVKVGPGFWSVTNDVEKIPGVVCAGPVERKGSERVKRHAGESGAQFAERAASHLGDYGFVDTANGPLCKACAPFANLEDEREVIVNHGDTQCYNCHADAAHQPTDNAEPFCECEHCSHFDDGLGHKYGEGVPTHSHYTSWGTFKVCKTCHDKGHAMDPEGGLYKTIVEKLLPPIAKVSLENCIVRRADWHCDFGERHLDINPFIPCQDCRRPPRTARLFRCGRCGLVGVYELCTHCGINGTPLSAETVAAYIERGHAAFQE